MTAAAPSPPDKETRRLREDIRWLLPAVARRSRYGVSSCKLLRHCLLDEPLDPHWERPHDHWDLLGVTKTVREAPEHHRAKAAAALDQFIAFMEAAGDSGYVERYRRALAEEDATSLRAGLEARIADLEDARRDLDEAAS